MKKIIKIVNAKDLPLQTQVDNNLFDGLVKVEFTRNSLLKITGIEKLTQRPSQMMFNLFCELRRL